jgi:hypothetical protein
MPETIQWSQIIDWGFQFVLIPSLYMGIRSLMHMTKSIETLNKQVAILITKYDNHEKRIDKLEIKF